MKPTASLFDGMSGDENFTANGTPSAASLIAMDTELRNRTVLSSCLMFSAGVVGNVLALALMATSPSEQKKTMFYKLMAGLAFTDLVGTCATSPVVITIYVTRAKLEKDMPLCHYFSFMMIFAGFATMSLVCAMAVERYICLCHPFTYRCKLPKSYAKYAFITSWLVSIIIATFPLMGLGHNAVQFPQTWCFFNSTSRDPKDRAFNLIYASISLIAILATLGCNVAAIFTVLAVNRRHNGFGDSQFPVIRRNRGLVQRYAELHMVVMLFGVTIVFIFCFGPLMIFTIICQTDLINHTNINKIYLLMIRLASFNPILDPWVYLLVRRELRWKIVCVFKFIFRIRRPPALSSTVQQSHLLPSPLPKPGSEMSCLTFCFHCLCDPPIRKSSASLAKSSTLLSGRTNASPSYIRRVASADSVMNRPSAGACIILQPSPSEELLLRKFPHSKSGIETYKVTESSLPQHRT